MWEAPDLERKLRTMKRKVKKTDDTWMKNHPMEGDDIVTSFYDFLCKRNPKTMKPCRNVFVPDTVVYEHNFPRGWYTTDVRACEVARRQGKDLDAATIEAGFKRGVNDACPIVATYLSRLEEDLGNGVTETTTQVEVLNKESVGGFIARKTKREGILQRFVFPKGYHNSVIKAVWSPRVAMIQRRTNKFPIMDRKRAENDPFAITVTYEGPEYLSEESTVSAHVAFEVKSICSDIVTHFFHTEHKHITRMVLYFKSDAKNRLWFLWCGSLRVADRNAVSEMPVNLAPKFGEPARDGDLDESEALRTADKAYFLITRDKFFRGTYMHENNQRSQSPDSVVSAARAMTADTETTKQKDAGGVDDLPPELVEPMGQLRVEEADVLDDFSDVFYRAYSHFLSSNPMPFRLQVPSHATEVLTESGVAELMRALKLQPEMGGDAEKEGEGGAATYVIPPKFGLPLTQLSDMAAEWIKKHFASRREALKQSFLAGELVAGLPPANDGAEVTEEI